MGQEHTIEIRFQFGVSKSKSNFSFFFSNPYTTGKTKVDFVWSEDLLVRFKSIQSESDPSLKI